MVWCGVVWCGVVWCAVVWCGVVHDMFSVVCTRVGVREGQVAYVALLCV